MMNSTRSLKIFFILNLLAVVGLCASAITAAKIVDFGFFVFPCSNIIFSLLTFPITDIISEVWGKQYAKITVYISFFAQALFVGLIQLSIYAPAASFWQNHSAYNIVLSTGPRVLIASMVAFLTAQFWDVYIYAYLKRSTKGRFLWIRNNISTFSSQLINSTLFITIVFYNKQPILPLIIGSIFLKWMIAAFDTPLVYYGVHKINYLLKGESLAFKATE